MNQLIPECRHLAFIIAAAMIIPGCARESRSGQARPAPESSAPAADGREVGVVREVIGAEAPTALAQASDGRLFFAERRGSVMVLDKSGQARTLIRFNVSTEGERGLLGLALHPQFPMVPYAYVFVSPRDDLSVSRVIRFDARGVAPVSEQESEEILTLPAGEGCCHKGGRLKFGPDGKLYISVGDNQYPRASAVSSDLRGKILRYNDDGSIPGDGPFAQSPVWATGFRNPFGISFGPDGTMWVTDNGPSGSDGPSCCDELNKVERGGDYGWPRGFGPRDETSVWSSGDETAVPTGVAVIEGEVAFCTYAWGKMVIYSDGQTRYGPDGCMLDVIQGLDGIYFSSTTAIKRV